MVFVHDDNCFPNEFACLSERHLACDDQITPYSEDYVYGFASAEGLASGNLSRYLICKFWGLLVKTTLNFSYALYIIRMISISITNIFKI